MILLLRWISIRDILQEMEGEALSVDSLESKFSEEASFWKSLTETAVCVLYPKFIISY
ncbi:hypothetical protein ANAPH1_00774 [Anaplasma phagocytophilum]|nr:hypothetical protein ANAPH1_00774 [Anaplasma phagocytophilum]